MSQQGAQQNKQAQPYGQGVGQSQRGGYGAPNAQPSWSTSPSYGPGTMGQPMQNAGSPYSLSGAAPVNGSAPGMGGGTMTQLPGQPGSGAGGAFGQTGNMGGQPTPGGIGATGRAGSNGQPTVTFDDVNRFYQGQNAAGAYNSGGAPGMSTAVNNVGPDVRAWQAQRMAAGGGGNANLQPMQSNKPMMTGDPRTLMGQGGGMNVQGDPRLLIGRKQGLLG